ncbi:MAG: 16S rRNA (guanine(527)-N(7))-methyltransferase RsmG [Sphingomicrobium sp.]
MSDALSEELSEIAGQAVSPEAAERLKEYQRLVIDENVHQNLVSRGTINSFWARHVLDSAQLVRLETHPGASWVDLGSGAGLPGVVIACLVDGPVTLVEPRALRADFLRRVVAELGLRASVIQSKAESVAGSFDVLTARAVAPLDRLLDLSRAFSTINMRHVYPKGKSARIELAEARRTWQGSFHVERSATDADSFIIVAEDVRARSR